MNDLDSILEAIREEFANNNLEDLVKELDFEEDLRNLNDTRNFGSDWDEE